MHSGLTLYPKRLRRFALFWPQTCVFWRLPLHSTMGFGTIGAVAIGKQPLGGTDPVSPLIDPKGHDYYVGEDICIELQGVAHKISRFPSQYTYKSNLLSIILKMSRCLRLLAHTLQAW